MIIWINGAFGAGKTSVAKVLVERLPEAMMYDPEIVGDFVKHLVPTMASEVDDLQDLPIWRTMVVATADALIEHHQCDLIVPMTLVVDAYRREILERLDYRHHVREFILEAGTGELDRRIREQVLIPDNTHRDAEVRDWRLAQIDRCVAALSAVDTPDRISTEELTVSAVADEILRLLDKDKPRRW
ncbi:MAG: AAA family ATPase [Actinomycetia bacterium]|nr:AAA family ATPase [Actinomycetes bacterium]MCP4957765.1 AAA family ATPase [Actinomycetes bacterium]